MNEFRIPPPRRLTWLSRLIILNDGFDVQFGWMFGGMGMIFFWVFFASSDISNWSIFNRGWEEQAATISHVSEELDDFNDSIKVYEYEYQVNGVTYSNRFEERFYINYEIGETIYIEYKKDDPFESRLSESYNAHGLPWYVVFIVAIFPIIGFWMLIRGMKKNLTYIGLLRKGHFTRGKMISKELGNSTYTINDRTYHLYDYVFEFEENGRIYKAKCSTYDPKKVEDETLESILFNRYDPSKNIVYDAIPSAPKMDEYGRFKQIWKVQKLILPFIMSFINLIGLFIFLLFLFGS